MLRPPQFLAKSWPLWRRVHAGNGKLAPNISNQVISADIDHRLQLLFQQFPTDEIRHAFGYGSGVFQQSGYQNANPQIDVVHIVDDPTRFHNINAEKHGDHYSALLSLGMSAVTAVQEYGAGVYFNPYVPMKDELGNEAMVKYGVVSTDNAVKDIREWSTLYIAGRLQKPVRHLHGGQALAEANDHNLSSAFKLALLLLRRKRNQRPVSATEIFEKIALLSYMGDPRMAVGGENPNKVKNIVSKQLDKFAQLYRPYLEHAIECRDLTRVGNDFELRMGPESISQSLATLPLQFRRRLLKSYSAKYGSALSKDESARKVISGESKDMVVGPFLAEILADKNLKRALITTLQATIAYPALVQSLKGIFTAGIIKSTRYAWEKKRKSWAR